MAQTDVCKPWKEIVPDPQNDHLTDPTAKQILVHDCVGAALGCWSYPGGDKQLCEGVK